MTPTPAARDYGRATVAIIIPARLIMIIMMAGPAAAASESLMTRMALLTRIKVKLAQN